MASSIKFETIKKIAETRFKYQKLNKISRLDTISPPAVFIGSKLRYPNVNIGILSPLEKQENSWIYDKEKYWADNNFEIKDVLQLRDNLLNSKFQSTVKAVNSSQNKFVQIAQDIAIASKPVDVEIELQRKVGFRRNTDKVLTTSGLKAPLKKAKVIGNVKVARQVDKVINDEIKSSEAMQYLYKKNFDEYTINKILSVGVLGLKKNKRFVPTRWSITATDDLIGKKLLNKVRDYKWLDNYELFFGEFMGNQYLIMLIPGVFSYELSELYVPGSSWNPSTEVKASTDYENYSGRKKYAFSTAGGYYAARLPIIEYLESQKRQASVFVMRIETPTYWAALGVWVVRESVRKALANRKLEFNSLEDLQNSAKKISQIKFNYDNSELLKRSKVLHQVKTQKSLRDFGV